MLKAVCWDMDGLIFNTEEVYRKSWEVAAADQHFSIPDTLYRDFIGRQDWECEDMLVAFTKGEIYIDRFRQVRLLDFEHRLKTERQYKGGFDELIQTIAEKGLKQALVTSSTLSEVERNFSGSDNLNYFETIITAESVKQGKPAPDGYLLACRKLGVKPAEAMVLEDSYNGIQAALKAGCISVMIPDMIPPSEELSNNVKIVSNLKSVICLLQ